MHTYKLGAKGFRPKEDSGAKGLRPKGVAAMQISSSRSRQLSSRAPPKVALRSGLLVRAQVRDESRLTWQHQQSPRGAHPEFPVLRPLPVKRLCALLLSSEQCGRACQDQHPEEGKCRLLCTDACVRACVRASMSVCRLLCIDVCVRACVRACTSVCGHACICPRACALDLVECCAHLPTLRSCLPLFY